MKPVRAGSGIRSVRGEKVEQDGLIQQRGPGGPGVPDAIQYFGLSHQLNHWLIILIQPRKSMIVPTVRIGRNFRGLRYAMVSES